MQNWLPVTWHGAKPVPDTGGFLPVEEPGYTRCLYCTKLVTSTKYRYDFPQSYEAANGADLAAPYTEQ